jgi:hypothetical protein
VTFGTNITSIGNNVFAGCTSLISITIPSGVTSIGNYDFSGCTDLTNVTIGTNVANIGNSAFYSCTSLTDVTIPNSVTNIGMQAFETCTSLSSIYFNGNAPVLGWGAFNNDPATIYCLPETTGWTNPWGGLPTVIRPFHFNYTKNSDNTFTITGYTGTNRVESIPRTIFGLPVTSIGDSAFASCTTLTSITIPDNVTNISSGAFFECNNLTKNVTTLRTSLSSLALATLQTLRSLIAQIL